MLSSLCMSSRRPAIAIAFLINALAACGSDDQAAGPSHDAASSDRRDGTIDVDADRGLGDALAPDSSSDASVDGPGPALKPWLGVNFTHFHAALDGNGIVAHYHQPGVRDLVKSHLAAMRANGASTTRLLLWHMNDVG